VLLRLEEVRAGGPPLLEDSGTSQTQIPHGSVGPEDQARGIAATGDSDAMVADPPAVSTSRSPRRPRRASPARPPRVSSRSGRGVARLRRTGAVVGVLIVLGLLSSAGYLALQSVYFVGTNSRGLVTLFRGVPYRLPGGVNLYSSDFVSGVSASTVSAERRRALLDHSLRTESDAAGLIRSLERGQLE
jgi:PPM family protein phosphatase